MWITLAEKKRGWVEITGKCNFHTSKPFDMDNSFSKHCEQQHRIPKSVPCSRSDHNFWIVIENYLGYPEQYTEDHYKYRVRLLKNYSNNNFKQRILEHLYLKLVLHHALNFKLSHRTLFSPQPPSYLGSGIFYFETGIKTFKLF